MLYEARVPGPSPLVRYENNVGSEGDCIEMSQMVVVLCVVCCVFLFMGSFKSDM